MAYLRIAIRVFDKDWYDLEDDSKRKMSPPLESRICGQGIRIIIQQESAATTVVIVIAIAVIMVTTAVIMLAAIAIAA